MLRIVKELYGYSIRATDGDIGKVADFYFDDRFWTVRYLVVDTSRWLSGRKTLISSAALEEPSWEEKAFPVSLTKEQVKNGPDIDTDKPISRQHEAELHKYYGWPIYWDYEAMASVAPMMSPQAERKKIATEQGGDDPYLRSMKEVADYYTHATDGEIGHVEDFVVADENWVVRYMVVNTRNWMPGKKVLVSPTWIDRVSWGEMAIHVNLTKSQVKNSPKFDPRQPVNREYEEHLYDFYGRPRYWV
jgi:hypothetical protein